LWQPWASAIAVGAKRVETRSWGTSYRGPVAIHASKRRHLWELISLGASWTWCGAFTSLGLDFGNGPKLVELLPFGAFVAVADLVDCRPTDSFTQAELDAPRRAEERGEHAHLYEWTERQMGDFSLGRFGWVLENIRRLPAPIPFRGRQGLWTIGPDAAAEIEALLFAEVPA
jgi:hypothetical protein